MTQLEEVDEEQAEIDRENLEELRATCQKQVDEKIDIIQAQCNSYREVVMMHKFVMANFPKAHIHWGWCFDGDEEQVH